MGCLETQRGLAIILLIQTTLCFLILLIKLKANSNFNRREKKILQLESQQK